MEGDDTLLLVCLGTFPMAVCKGRGVMVAVLIDIVGVVVICGERGRR